MTYKQEAEILDAFRKYMKECREMKDGRRICGHSIEYHKGINDAFKLVSSYMANPHATKR